MDMKFDEETKYTQNPMGPQPSGMAAKLIKIGFAKNEKQANYILFGLIGVSAVIFFISMSSGTTVDNDYDPTSDEIGLEESF